MFGYFAKKARHRRAAKYIEAHPEDQPAAQAVVTILDELAPKSAREVAEMTVARPLTDAEWRKIGPQWKRAWNAIH